jgi:hypothetical protein
MRDSASANFAVDEPLQSICDGALRNAVTALPLRLMRQYIASVMECYVMRDSANFAVDEPLQSICDGALRNAVTALSLRLMRHCFVV